MSKVFKVTDEELKKFKFDFNEEAFNRSLEEARPQLEAWGVIPPLKESTAASKPDKLQRKLSKIHDFQKPPRNK